ncbi:hypothetical protein AYO22_01846 [Fonsecaea multimorphosa]|nr:hypothetical protein AYO22_01846 [Fonsecaea multimorphosa]
MIPQYDGPTDGIDSHNDLRDDPGPQDSGSTRLNMSDLFDGRTPEQLEKSVEKSLDLLKRIKQTLGEESDAIVSRWSREIASVQSQAISPKTVIGVVGATGAGKSSVINAVLDEERLLPTSCMRACTAVVTEISYNHQGGAPYRAVVEFISKEDWRKTLNVLFQDLVNSSGQVFSDYTNEDSESGSAYAQVKAVYPRLTKEEMVQVPIDKLMEHQNVAYLDTKRVIESGDVTTFYKELQGFVGSKEKKTRETEFWPLIRVVKLYVKAPVLATGAVIVDLPGMHDSNQARAAVARDYMKQCSRLLIVAPITRAIDDKTAKTLLGDSFKCQLKMDGGLTSVTFVCSKTDDILVTEAQDALGLGEELEVMWAEQRGLEKKKEELEKEIKNLENSRHEMEEAIDKVKDRLAFLRQLQRDLAGGKANFRPERKSAKRKFSDISSWAEQAFKVEEPSPERDCTSGNRQCASTAQSDYASSNACRGQDGPITADEISRGIAQSLGSKRDGDLKIQKVDGQIQALRARVREVDKEHESIPSKVTARCIAARNDHSRVAIRQDYAAGIRELDQELAEEEDAEKFDPEVDARDYAEVARNLPVFCVSSRAYQKLKGRLHKDTTPPGFLHLNATEIPALQAHCVQLTAEARQATSRKFLTSMFQLLNSLRLWASNDSAAKNLTAGQSDREAQILEEKLKEPNRTLKKACDDVVNKISDELQDEICGAYPFATATARDQASDIVRKWGGLHWQTYKAVVRRDGRFTNKKGYHNFNKELLEPLIRRLARPWEFTFSRTIPVTLDELPSSVAHHITAFHNVVERRAVRNGSYVSSFRMLKQQIPVYQEKLKVAITDAKSWVTEQQRDCHREFEPFITAHMRPVYVACNNESGSGQYKRMKEKMERYVRKQKKHMFHKAVDHVDELIQQIPRGVRESLRRKINGIFKAVRRDYKSVVVRQKARPLERKASLDKILDIVDSAELVFKQATENQPEHVDASGTLKQDSGKRIFSDDPEEERTNYFDDSTFDWLKHGELDNMTDKGFRN